MPYNINIEDIEPYRGEDIDRFVKQVRAFATATFPNSTLLTVNLKYVSDNDAYKVHDASAPALRPPAAGAKRYAAPQVCGECQLPFA